MLDGLTIEGDAFEDLIDKRLTQHERRSKKAVARSKAKQQEKAVAKKASNKSHMGP
ncbi:MAG TPA: hypothetical protein PLL92_02440 [Alicycliphilus sp.]|nr:hypothetical protein [Alicycliphilus sp.]